jgi:hypothetical protein
MKGASRNDFNQEEVMKGMSAFLARRIWIGRAVTLRRVETGSVRTADDEHAGVVP